MSSLSLKRKETICGDCGRMNIGYQEKCLVCTGDLCIEGRQNYSRPSKQQQMEGNFSTCTSCGEQIDTDMLYCTNCGAKKEEIVTPYCSGCGIELDEDQLFCTECGMKVDK